MMMVEWLAALPRGSAVQNGSARRRCNTGPAERRVTGGPISAKLIFPLASPEVGRKIAVADPQSATPLTNLPAGSAIGRSFPRLRLFVSGSTRMQNWLPR